MPTPAALSAAMWDADPFGASDPVTGDIWFGGMTLNMPSPRGIFVARKPAGSGTLPAPSVVTYFASPSPVQDDKPLMAIGRHPAVPSQRSLYIAFSLIGDTHLGNPAVLCPNLHFMIARSDDLGVSWAISPVAPAAHLPFGLCLYSGLGAVPLVLSTGRVVVVMGYSAAYSDDGGATWSGQTLAFPGVSPGFDTDIAGKFRVPFFSGAARDPASDDIYIVTSARAAANSPNLDIWVARSTNGAQTFDPTVRLPLNTELAYQPDQVMPWIAVDRAGGAPALNLVYYDTKHQIVSDSSPAGYLDAYYARVTGFATPSQNIFTARLTPSTFSTATPQYEGFASNPSLDQFVGDYQMIDARGCDVYPCYMSMHEGVRHYYIHRINLCTADVDRNGEVNSGDFAAFFGDFYPAGGPRADVTGDGLVNVSDAATFSAAYAGGPP